VYNAPVGSFAFGESASSGIGLDTTEKLLYTAFGMVGHGLVGPQSGQRYGRIRLSAAAYKLGAVTATFRVYSYDGNYAPPAIGAIPAAMVTLRATVAIAGTDTVGTALSNVFLAALNPATGRIGLNITGQLSAAVGTESAGVSAVYDAIG